MSYVAAIQESAMKVLGFWNNKGGTGKTSLAFQTACAFADQNPAKKLLVFDVCPQANLSELFLGGQENEGGKNLLSLHGESFRRSIGGYFQDRLPKPYSAGTVDPSGFISHPFKYNNKVPNNIYLVAGDPLLELQSNAISTLANTQIPGTDSWASITSWMRDFIQACGDEHEFGFVDMNPSFSMYTQIALAACNRLVLPVTADDSSRRGIQNALSLIYGLSLPSEIYAQHNFHTRLQAANMPPPKIHLIAKNRLTQYVRTAKGYSAVLDGITSDLHSVLKSNRDIFTFAQVDKGLMEIRDFQSAGVVAFARGTPFSTMQAGTLSVATQRVQVNNDQLQENKTIIGELAKRLW
jgi:cellulose biosynthesis protein BcsQ